MEAARGKCLTVTIVLTTKFGFDKRKSPPSSFMLEIFLERALMTACGEGLGVITTDRALQLIPHCLSACSRCRPPTIISFKGPVADLQLNSWTSAHEK